MCRCLDIDARRWLPVLLALCVCTPLACDAPRSDPAPARQPAEPPPPIEVPGTRRDEPVADPNTPDPTSIDAPTGDVCIHPDDLLPVAGAPVRGAPGAMVTLVVFASFTDAASRWLGTEALPSLLADYGGQLRVVFKHAPPSMSGEAGTAARAGWAAHQQGRFWQLHDALYEVGDALRLDDLGLAERASAAGLDVRRLEDDLAAPAARDAVAADLELARRLGVREIPAVFVNGEEIEGDLDLEQLEQAIEQRLAACAN